jgi:hypothetical protein
VLATPAVVFYEVVLALHILAVVFAISQRVIMPGVALIVVFGIYLASNHHLWNTFFVQWGLGVAIVIGAVEGMYLGPREKRLIEVADRDLAAAGDGPVTASAEHDALVKRIGAVGALMDLLVVITIYFMVTHTGS